MANNGGMIDVSDKDITIRTAKTMTINEVKLLELSVGSKLKLGESVELEITQFGKKCHSRCEIFEQVGDCFWKGDLMKE